MTSRWGDRGTTLRVALRHLRTAGIRIERVSRCYATAPIGPVPQSPYVNAVAAVTAELEPGALLRLLKRLEREAGRRTGRRWGPRPLDLDILDHAGHRLGWPHHGWLRRGPVRGDRSELPRVARSGPGQARPSLVLPHPELHRRAFVLGPLLDIAPHWHHPVLDRTARALWLGLTLRQRRSIAALPQSC